MGMNFSAEGYDGTQFRDFEIARQSHSGPGWFIIGRDKKKYGTLPDGRGRYISLCGYVREGKARNYNGRVRIGWRTKKEAQAALDAHLKSSPHLARAAQVDTAGE